MCKRKKPTAVIILGMHRSGTSCLAGSLEMHGLHLGKVNTEARYNKKGNRENQEIMDLNDKLLHNSGGSWDNPPKIVRWNEDDRVERDRILSEYPTGKTWGFKDPRTLFTLDGWLEAISNFRIVGSFRWPGAVAASLNYRNNFDFERGYQLWSLYNNKLLDYHKQFGFPLICFDWPEDFYTSKVRRIASDFGLENNTGENENFFDGNLRHHKDLQDKPIPESVIVIYKKLLDIADL